ncbi:MAG: M20/M25/M40 family metallo-hydrolase [Rickettsiales bacterium]|nr:M20/M25/M40 family metallo-hydrolase [Rickettsiales bacterium]
MFDLLEKLVKYKTTEGNYKEIDDAIACCLGYFGELKIFTVEKTIDKNKSIFISNANDFNVDVLSICHMDVVPMQSNIYDVTKRNNNIICGRGVFDMKGFLVSAIHNLKKAVVQNIKTKYGVLIVSNEETATESDTKHWSNIIKTKVVLDSDSGNGDINSIVKDNLGAITIKLSKLDAETIDLIKRQFSEFYCDVVENEIDILFNDENIKENLEKCMRNDTKIDVLMFNNYIKNNINDKCQILYKNLLKELLNIDVKYITSRTTTDSRFFSGKCDSIISHQAIGGNYHSENEWLDFNSLIKFNELQFEFLKNYNK